MINLTNKPYAFANPVDLGIWQALQEVKDAVESGSSVVPTGPTNIYVSTTGNDLNDGKTLETAFRTVTRAVIESEKIVNGYYRTIINIDAGDYSAEEYLYLGVYPSFSRDFEIALNLKSISNVSTDVILPTVRVFGGMLQLSSVTVKGSQFGFGLVAHDSGGIYATDLITLNTSFPLNAYKHGRLTIQNLHVKDSTIPGDSGVCSASGLSLIQIYGTMQNTNSTGPRYVVDELSIIQTYGQGENYLPGTTAGTATNGGIYA
jgi:hypothetical protein